METKVNDGKPKPVVSININNGDKKLHQSISEAARYLNISCKSIYNVLKGDRTSTSGYTFKYFKKYHKVDEKE